MRAHQGIYSVTKETESQADKFEQAARELDVELDEEKLKEALRRIAPKRPAEKPWPEDPKE